MAELLSRSLHLPMAFLQWWSGELAGLLLPRSAGAGGQRSKASLILHLSADDAALIERTARRGERELDRASGEELKTTSGAALPSFGARKYRKWPVVLRLGGDLGLRKMVDLPLAARDDLGQLLHFELDRLTPFKADDVCFAWRVLETDARSGRMQVDLEMAPKAIVDRGLALAKRHGREVSRVELGRADRDDAKDRDSLDLLPKVVEARQGKGWFGRLLPLVALGLGVTAAVLPLQKKYKLLGRLENEVAVVRAEAEQSLAIREQIDVLVRKARFLVSNKNRRLTMTEVLAELTRTIPDHSHIIQLQIRDDSVELNGLADRASDLIAILDESPMLASPQFRSPVTRDPRTDKERFQISVNLSDRAS